MIKQINIICLCHQSNQKCLITMETEQKNNNVGQIESLKEKVIQAIKQV